MVAPLLELLLLRLLRRRGAEAAPEVPTRLVGAARPVDSLAYVADGTSVLLEQPGGGVQVLPAGSLVWPPLLRRTGASSVVVTHQPVDVWLRIGPFETRDGRFVQQVELRLRVSLTGSPSGLADLVEADAVGRGPASTTGATTSPGSSAATPAPLAGLGDRLLERLAREVSARTTDAVHRRTLGELADLSVAVVLDEALPTRFLGGALERSSLEVVDVDWPTEGRGWPNPVGAAAPVAALGPGGAARAAGP